MPYCFCDSQARHDAEEKSCKAKKEKALPECAATAKVDCGCPKWKEAGKWYASRADHHRLVECIALGKQGCGTDNSGLHWESVTTFIIDCVIIA